MFCIFLKQFPLSKFPLSKLLPATCFQTSTSLKISCEISQGLPTYCDSVVRRWSFAAFAEISTTNETQTKHDFEHANGNFPRRRVAQSENCIFKVSSFES